MNNNTKMNTKVGKTVTIKSVEIPFKTYKGLSGVYKVTYFKGGKAEVQTSIKGRLTYHKIGLTVEQADSLVELYFEEAVYGTDIPA